MATPAVEFTVIGNDKASATFTDIGASAQQSSQKINAAADESARGLDRVAGAADSTASASAQAAGGIGDIAGALEATGLISEGTAQAMETGAAAIMGLTGAADIANLVTEKFKIGLIGQKIAMVAGAVATGVVTAAQWAWNAAMSANPIGLIIIAIAALVAGIVWLVANWDTVKAAGVSAWNWIKDAWSGAGTFFSGIWAALPVAAKIAFNSIAGWWNNSIGKIGFTVPSWIPEFGGRSFSVPDIPLLAHGGDVARGGFAVVGEAGAELLELPAGARVTPLNNSNPAGRPGNTVNVENFYAGGLSLAGVGDAIAWRLGR